MHSLQTCKFPLSALAAYYRRSLRTTGGTASGSGWEPDRRQDLRIAVSVSPEAAGAARYVDVTVVEWAAHTAYLEPITGSGMLVTAHPAADVASPDGWPDCVARSQTWGHLPAVGLSLQAAALAHALERLASGGWMLLEDDSGADEIAGHTVDGRHAVFVYADATTDAQLVLEDFQSSLTALHIAAGLSHGTDRG